MADEKVYVPETIQDQPFPQEGVAVSYDATQPSANQTYTPSVVKDQTFPTKRIAVELIGSALNTKSRKILGKFEFTKSGSIQVGTYENGVSGDIRISPTGISARNLSGVTTFALDGDTGDAVFAGQIQAGALIAGAVAVGDGDILIDGESKRMVFYDESGIPVIIIGNA